MCFKPAKGFVFIDFHGMLSVFGGIIYGLLGIFNEYGVEVCYDDGCIKILHNCMNRQAAK
jgi:hypothetical protein